MRTSDILKGFCRQSGDSSSLEVAIEILKSPRGYIIVSDNMSQYPDFTKSAFDEIKGELEKIGRLKSWIGEKNKYVCYKFANEEE